MKIKKYIDYSFIGETLIYYTGELDMFSMKKHNPHGPAFIRGNHKSYYCNNKWHNIVGPARELPHGTVFIINGISIE